MYVCMCDHYVLSFEANKCKKNFDTENIIHQEKLLIIKSVGKYYKIVTVASNNRDDAIIV